MSSPQKRATQADITKGDKLRTAGDLDGALAQYTQTLDAMKRSFVRGEGYFRRGLAYRAKGDFAAALADYGRCLEEGQGFIPPEKVYFYRGNAYASAGNIQAAQADHQRVVEGCLKEDAPSDYNPQSVHPSDFENAVIDCTTLLASRPDLWQVYFCRGIARRHLKDWQLAEADYALAVRLNPNNRRLHEWQLSLPILQQGFTNFPNKPAALPAHATFCHVALVSHEDSAMVVYYDAQGSKFAQHTLDEGKQLQTQLRRDGWMLLERSAHQESLDYFYWKPV